MRLIEREREKRRRGVRGKCGFTVYINQGEEEKQKR